MTEIGKVLVALGLGVAVLGLALWGLGRLGFRGLPGDIRVEGAGFRFYFPIVSCVVLSLVLTGAAWLWQWLCRR